MLLMLLIAMFLALEARHLDFKTAFLNIWLGDVTIYMSQPKYFYDGKKRVFQLKIRPVSFEAGSKAVVSDFTCLFNETRVLTVRI